MNVAGARMVHLRQRKNKQGSFLLSTNWRLWAQEMMQPMIKTYIKCRTAQGQEITARERTHKLYTNVFLLPLCENIAQY